MTHHKSKLWLTMAAALTLSACGSGGGDNIMQPGGGGGPNPPPPPPPPPVGDPGNFGAGFEFAFNQDAFAEPVNPVQGDIIALTKTENPEDIPDP